MPAQPGQNAGAIALAQIFPVVGASGIDGGAAAMAIRLTRLLSSDSFAPKAALLSTLTALLEACGPGALGPDDLHFVLGEAPPVESPTLHGGPAPPTPPLAARFSRAGRGSGLAGALSSDDWAVRKAAAEALGAAARRLGPAIDAGERRSDLIEA